MEKKEKSVTKTTTNKTLLTSSQIPQENQEMQKIILDLHNKMETNTVLNGGFDVLLEKVKNIEEDIGELRESVYDQNSGIFTKVKELENHTNLRDLEVKNKLNVFDEILQKHEKKIEEDSKKSNDYMDKLNESMRKIELKMNEIDLWKKMAIAIGGMISGVLINQIIKLLGL